MSKPIFRKTSLDRLSSPEQLDVMMRVSSPWGWLSLIAVGCLMVTAVLWGIYGEIPTKVNGQGILIKSGGIHNVTSQSDGQVIDLRIVHDDFVHKGETIARISQPDLLRQLGQAQADLASMAQHADETGFAERIVEAQRIVAELQLEYDNSSRVVSPYSGRVIELKAARGDFISAGTPIVSVELSGDEIKDLIAVMYIPAHDGKKLIPGMEVQISPTSVKKEQFGFMMGKVTSVSEFPSTLQGMMQTLGNEAVVKALSGSEASLEIRVDLIPDENTFSGYKWSTQQGPPLHINSGTMFIGSVTIDKQRPIANVLPIFQ